MIPNLPTAATPFIRRTASLVLALLAVSSARAQDPQDIKSDPVSWAFVRTEGSSISLDGVFQIELKGAGHWRRRPAVAAPTGGALNSWDILSDKDEKIGMFAVVDVEVDKLPEGKREAFVRALAQAFQRTGAAAMAKTGFAPTGSSVTAADAKWPHTQLAVTRFERADETQVSFTYLYPAARLYVVSCTVPSDEEPSWFRDTCQSLDCK
jgi:hypothetical protein